MNHDKKWETKTRLLLHCGTQWSYISEELVKKMNLKPISKNLLTSYIFGITKPNNIKFLVVELGILLNNGFAINIKANVVPYVTRLFENKLINNKSIKKYFKNTSWLTHRHQVKTWCWSTYWKRLLCWHNINEKNHFQGWAMFVRSEIRIDPLWQNTIWRFIRSWKLIGSINLLF